MFSRQVSAGERAAILSTESARRLAERGFPEVTLGISDRRLLIEGTTLGELREGLAHELAILLEDIDRILAEERDRRDAEALALRTAEADRAAGVQHLVEGIRFE